MSSEETVETIRIKYQTLSPYLNEKTRRIWSATEALALGRGGISAVAQATNLSRNTIYKGIKAITPPINEPQTDKGEEAIRQRGSGRKLLQDKDPSLLEDLISLVESSTRGDPESPLLWTCKSTTKLAKELQAMGHCVSQRSVYRLLAKLEYSLQLNQKTVEGADQPDRDQQFLHITKRVKHFQRHHQPVISVDAKKKELIGNFKNNGREWAKKQHPIEVNLHDFADEKLGKVSPYGVYDLDLNQGWVSVGISHDTAQFAVESIRRWWYAMGQFVYSQAQHLLITADCGGSNGNRTKLWKVELQRLADELGMTIHVCHFPPGTSKWNKIEHRMFCHISENWRGKPLTSWQVVINLISHTHTYEGLEIQAKLDKHHYKTGIEVSDAEFNAITIEQDRFHGEWNYQIQPRIIT
jgi:hypothetical protein